MSKFEEPYVTEFVEHRVQDARLAFLGLILRPLQTFWLWWNMLAAKVVFAGFAYFERPSAEDAKKMHRLSVRALWLCHAVDILITFRAISEEFLEYTREKRGFVPTVLVPYELKGDHGEDLAGSVEADDALMRRLLYSCRGFRAHPMIQREGWARLATKLGLQALMSKEALIKNDQVLRLLNDKRWIQALCDELGIPIPASRWVYAYKDSVFEAILKLFLEHAGLGRAQLRLDRSAGGLAVKTIARQMPGGDLLYYHNQMCQIDWNAWHGSQVAVEPFLEAVEFPLSVVMDITPFGPKILELCDRLVVNGTESAGGTIPSVAPQRLQKRAVLYARRIGWELRRLGYRGRCDIDLGLYEGTLVMFEVNARRLATCTILQQRNELAQAGDTCMALDCIRVGNNVSLNRVRAFLQDATIKIDGKTYAIDYDRDRRWGVLITLPPSNGYMAFSIIGKNHAHARAMRERVCRWAWLISTRDELTRPRVARG
jgi:hypothetical protein